MTLSGDGRCKSVIGLVTSRDAIEAYDGWARASRWLGSLLSSSWSDFIEPEATLSFPQSSAILATGRYFSSFSSSSESISPITTSSFIQLSVISSMGREITRGFVCVTLTSKPLLSILFPPCWLNWIIFTLVSSAGLFFSSAAFFTILLDVSTSFIWPYSHFSMLNCGDSEERNSKDTSTSPLLPLFRGSHLFSICLFFFIVDKFSVKSPIQSFFNESSSKTLISIVSGDDSST